MMNCKTLGTLPQMMAQMEEQYDCEHQFLDISKNNGSKNYIQAFWLPAQKRFEKLHDTYIQANCTMIICNPNMGYAEVQ